MTAVPVDGVRYWFDEGAGAFTAPGRPPLPVSGRPAGPTITPYESITAAGSVSAKIDSVGTAQEVSFATGIVQFADFAEGGGVYGMLVLKAAGLRGSGVGQTIFQMTPNSSTQAAKVPASNPPASNGQTNPLRLIRVGWESAATPRHLSGFTVQATPQGHLYHGLQAYYVVGGSVWEDLRIAGIPGDMSREPGETFSLEAYRCTGTPTSPVLFRRVEVDGRDTTGRSVAASGVGVNFGSYLQFDDVNSHHMAQSHGYAAYTTSNLVFNRCAATNVALNGFNFENVSGAVQLNNCTMNTCAAYHVAIATNTGSATYVINDPVYDGAKLQIRATGYSGGARTQDLNAIHLYVGGVERPDLIQWILT